MVKRELTRQEFETIKASLAASIARGSETGGSAEHGTDNTLKAAETWGRARPEASIEEDLLTLLAGGTLYIEMDE